MSDESESPDVVFKRYLDDADEIITKKYPDHDEMADHEYNNIKTRIAGYLMIYEGFEGIYKKLGRIEEKLNKQKP